LTAEPRLSYLIGRLDRVLSRRLAAVVEPMGLTLPAYTALSVLQAQDGLSNAQLARRSLVTPQSMSEVLALLVDRGYVRRGAESGQGRAIRTEITRAGVEVLDRCGRAVDELEREMLADLGEEAVVALREALASCGRSLGHEEPARAAG
jgi:DNA-binding MarR family transcriptional regulator